MRARTLAVVIVMLCTACASPLAPPDAGVSSEFAGAWGSFATALFNWGTNLAGSYGYETVMVIAVGGNATSVSGFCPDGSGTMTLSGSGTAATYSGSLACAPAVAYGNVVSCRALVLSHNSATLTLTGHSTLTLTQNGTLTGCGEPARVVTTVHGWLATTPWDIRFKGIGQTPYFTPGYPTAPTPAPDAAITVAGSGNLAWGLLGQESLYALDAFYAPAQVGWYLGSVWSEGSCPKYFADAVAGNYVVTGLVGDPNNDVNPYSYCSILGVSQADGGPTFHYLTEGGVSADHIRAQLGGTQSARSYVLTAIYQVDAGLYAYVAESLGELADGGYEQFDTVIWTASLDELANEAADLADAGYVITASAWQGETYYTLVGTRAVGSRASYQAMTISVSNEIDLSPGDAMLGNGFVPVSAQGVSTVLDGGPVEWLIGEDESRPLNRHLDCALGSALVLNERLGNGMDPALVIAQCLVRRRTTTLDVPTQFIDRHEAVVLAGEQHQQGVDSLFPERVVMFLALDRPCRPAIPHPSEVRPPLVPVLFGRRGGHVERREGPEG